MTCERGGSFNDSCLYSQALDTTRGQIQQNKQRCTEVCSNSITVCTSCLVLEVIGMHDGTALEVIGMQCWDCTGAVTLMVAVLT